MRLGCVSRPGVKNRALFVERTNVTSIIMAVDDEVFVLRLLGLVLQPLECSVLAVEDPRKALQLLESVTPDVFILDLMMPHINGLEMCRQIRASRATAQTPIIILSAYYDAGMVEKCLQAGATLFLPKSMLHGELVEQVRNLLNLASVS
jgi:two-component system alkaline phosphatase synthesis response regulator PhoP